MKNLRANFGRVIVKELEAKEVTSGGLYIPDTAKEKPNMGTVIELGATKDDEPVNFKVGDVVIYGKYVGTEVELEGEKYKVLKQDEVLASYTPDEE